MADGDILMYQDAGAYLIFIYITLILMNMDYNEIEIYGNRN